MRDTARNDRWAGALAAALIAGCGAMPPAEEGGVVQDLSVAGDSGGGGGCQPKCSGLMPHCNASGHCVGCLDDGQCAMGSYCKKTGDAIANCTPGCVDDARCAAGQKCCNAACVDPESDVRHCGACGKACMAAHAAAKCTKGLCESGACDPGWGDCDGDTANGCEANLSSDPNHCTGCGKKCAIPNAVAGCANGCYATACNFGFDDCNKNAMDGCETSVLGDKANCGGCGKPCLNLPNATASCTNGACLLGQCNNGFANCDGNAQNGCEVATSADKNNCGGCGNMCAINEACSGGRCTCPMCNFPHASAKCVNNMCVFDQCNQGWADCNANAQDGCEVSILTDKNNCGQCAKVCPVNQTCVNGACMVGAVIDTHNLGGHTEWPLDPEICKCCGNGVTTKQTADALCVLAGFNSASSWVSGMIVGNNCYCWNCTQVNKWSDNCCGGQASRPMITQVTCQ